MMVFMAMGRMMFMLFALRHFKEGDICFDICSCGFYIINVIVFQRNRPVMRNAFF